VTEPAALPWDPPPPADPTITWAPTIYRDDPDSVVRFLLEPPWHLTRDAAWANDEDGDDS
jgi:hypothetical protein